MNINEMSLKQLKEELSGHLQSMSIGGYGMKDTQYKMLLEDKIWELENNPINNEEEEEYKIIKTPQYLSYLAGWNYFVLQSNDGKTQLFHVPTFMLKMMVENKELIEIFLSENWFLDTEFDESTSEQIKTEILEKEVKKREEKNHMLVLEPNERHSISGVGHSMFDIFRINCIIFNNIQ